MPSDYRPPKNRGEGGTFRVIEAILDWPLKIAEFLFSLCFRAWDKLPRWLGIPLVALLGLTALYFLAYNLWYWTVGYENP